MSTVHPVSNLRISISLAASKRFLSISTFFGKESAFSNHRSFLSFKGKMQHLNFLETSVKMMPKQAGSRFALTQSVNETEQRELGHEMNYTSGC